MSKNRPDFVLFFVCDVWSHFKDAMKTLEKQVRNPATLSDVNPVHF